MSCVFRNETTQHGFSRGYTVKVQLYYARLSLISYPLELNSFKAPSISEIRLEETWE